LVVICNRQTAQIIPLHFFTFSTVKKDSKLRADNVMRFAFSVDRQIAASLVWTW